MRATSATHYYRQDGTPCYTIIGSNGKERPVTIRDARKLKLAPGVTSIIRCAAAPELEYWKENQIMLATLTLPRRPHEPEKAWIQRVWLDGRETARKAAERGTAIHKAIEHCFAGVPYAAEYSRHVNGAVNVLKEAAGRTYFSTEKAFCHPLGFGGKVDLSAASFESLERVAADLVIDIKTKEFDESATLTTYDEHHMQLAAYREGLRMPRARCGILYVSATVPGLARLLWIDAKQLLRGWTMFTSLHKYWCARNRYFPAERIAA